MLTFRSDAYMATANGKHPNGAVLTRTKTTFADVWLSPSESWYRVDAVSLNEKNQLDVFRREFCLTPEYAAIQDYDCRPQGSTKPLDVCFIHVVGSYGDTRDWDVNMLQFPSDNFWTRGLMTGKIPASYDGIPVSTNGGETIYKNFGESPDKMLTEAVKTPLVCKASYVDGKVSSVLQCNGYDSATLRAYRDIRWGDRGITSFRYTEESIQARELKRPRLEMRFTLVSGDGQPSPVALKPKARVMDYRLCAAVPLNDFPDRSCQPKTYLLGARLETASELAKAEEAMFERMPAKVNQTPTWIWGISITTFLMAGVAFVGAFRRVRVRS